MEGISEKKKLGRMLKEDVMSVSRGYTGLE